MSEQKEIKPVRHPFDWMPTIEIKNLGSGERPSIARKGSIGYDLSVARDTFIAPHSRTIVKTDIAISLPPNVEAKVEARSGFSVRGIEGVGVRKVWRRVFGFIPWLLREREVRCFDADVITGKIDPGYKDNIGIIVKNNEGGGFVITAGTRLAQLTFYRVVHPRLKLVKELSGEDRGGGFGSTGA